MLYVEDCWRIQIQKWYNTNVHRFINLQCVCSTHSISNMCEHVWWGAPPAVAYGTRQMWRNYWREVWRGVWKRHYSQSCQSSAFTHTRPLGLNLFWLHTSVYGLSSISSHTISEIQGSHRWDSFILTGRTGRWCPSYWHGLLSVCWSRWRSPSPQFNTVDQSITEAAMWKLRCQMWRCDSGGGFLCRRQLLSNLMFHRQRSSTRDLWWSSCTNNCCWRCS